MKGMMAVGGLGALAIGALFVYNRNKKKPYLEREEVVHLLKKLRQQMYINFVEISSWVKENASQVPPDVIRNTIMGEQNPFKEAMDANLSKVFTDISKEDFEQCLEAYYANDVQIQYHVKQYQQEFQKVLLGVSPQLKEQIIYFLSPHKILAIVAELFDQKIARISQQVKSVPLDRFQQICKDDVKVNSALKIKKLKSLGLTMREETLHQIFEFSISKYIRMSSEFQNKYHELVQKYQLQLAELLEKHYKICEYLA